MSDYVPFFEVSLALGGEQTGVEIRSSYASANLRETCSLFFHVQE